MNIPLSSKSILLVSLFLCICLVAGCAPPAAPTTELASRESEETRKIEQLSPIVLSVFGGPDTIICKVFDTGDKVICLRSQDLIPEYARLYGHVLALSAVEDLATAITRAPAIQEENSNYWESFDRPKPNLALVLCAGGVHSTEIGELNLGETSGEIGALGPGEPSEPAELEISDEVKERLRDQCNLRLQDGNSDFMGFEFDPLEPPGRDTYFEQVEDAIGDIEDHMERCKELGGGDETVMFGTAPEDIIKHLAEHEIAIAVAHAGIGGAGANLFAVMAAVSFVEAVIGGIADDSSRDQAWADIFAGKEPDPNGNSNYERYYTAYANMCEGDASKDGCKPHAQRCADNPDATGCTGKQVTGKQVTESQKAIPKPTKENEMQEGDGPSASVDTGNSASMPIGEDPCNTEEVEFFLQTCAQANWESYECRTWVMAQNNCVDPAVVLPLPDGGDYICPSPYDSEELKKLAQQYACAEKRKVMLQMGMNNTTILPEDCPDWTRSSADPTNEEVRRLVIADLCTHLTDLEGRICGGYTKWTSLGLPPNTILGEEISELEIWNMGTNSRE